MLLPNIFKRSSMALQIRHLTKTINVSIKTLILAVDSILIGSFVSSGFAVEKLEREDLKFGFIKLNDTVLHV